MKNKRIIVLFIILLVILSSSCVIYYFQNISPNIMDIKYIDYIAVSSSEHLSMITIKKELKDQKDYYKAGDDIKYDITITNNNNEAVVVNLEDNYNNVENTQRNLIIESVSCEGKKVNTSSNKIIINNITLPSKGSYKCSVDAYAKKAYTEGKVNSRSKVYIDDEDEYKESDFTYLVQDTNFDIQLDKVDSFSKFNNEGLTYNLKIKNLDTENKSGKIDIMLYINNLGLIIDEPFSNNYEVEFTGSNKEVITSKAKFECLTTDGADVCVPNKNQMLKFAVNGLNPNETINLTVQLKMVTTIYSAQDIKLTSVVHAYNVDNTKMSKYYKREHKLVFTSSNSGDTYGEVYTADSSGNIIYDLHDTYFKDKKGELYLHYNYHRAQVNFRPNQGTGDQMTIRHVLPSNVLYDKNRDFKTKNCNPFNFTDTKTSSGLVKLATTCGLDIDEYFSSVDVPIIITRSMLNKKICFPVDTSMSPRLQANEFCIGPDLALDNKSSSIRATQDENKVITLQFVVRNYANGFGKDAIVSMSYNSGLTVNNNSLSNGINNNTAKLVTWTLPVIAPYRTNTVTLTLNNPNDLSTLNLTFTIEGKTVTKTITIEKARVDEPVSPDTPNYIKGDWDQNGKVTTTDLMYARNYLAKTKELALPPVEIYDFDGNKKPGLPDLNGLRNLLANMKI